MPAERHFIDSGKLRQHPDHRGAPISFDRVCSVCGRRYGQHWGEACDWVMRDVGELPNGPDASRYRSMDSSRPASKEDQGSEDPLED